MLAALRQFQTDIVSHMQRNVSDAFEEFGFLMLKITIKSVAVALHDVLLEQQGRSDSTRRDRKYSGLTGYNSSIPTYTVIENAVRRNWPTVAADASRIFSSPAVRRNGDTIRIRLWNAGVPNQFNTAADAKQAGISQFKDTFAKILENLIGTAKFNRIRHKEGARTSTGPNAFKKVFTLSHHTMTAGEQTGEALRGTVNQRGKDATDAENLAKSAKLKNWNAGKAKFYDLASVKMNSVLAAATYVKLDNHVKGVKVGNKTHKMPGNFGVIFGFDEIEANIAMGDGTGGPLTKRDIGILRKEWNDWANDFLGELITAQFGMDVWELKGSTSRKTSYEVLTEEAVVGELLKGSKKFLKRKSKPKKIKAKKQSTKPELGRKKKTRKITHQQMVVAKSGKRYAKSSPQGKMIQSQGGTQAISGSPIALIQLLNKILPAELQKNMTGVYPRSLEWRTGRFGESAEVTSIVPFGKMTQIQYTYMKNPYQVFEDQGGRDPRKIIGGTIREIAQSMMGDKFGLVRTKRV